MPVHPLKPVIFPDSQTLILGSFPSVLSRKEGFYYAHPRNRFWRVLASCFEEPLPLSVSEKTALLRRHRLALWDVARSCAISGSSDASMRDVVPNEIDALIKSAPIRLILLNGRAAEKYFSRYFPSPPVPCLFLPSTSPANAAVPLERLNALWHPALKGERLTEYTF